MSSGQQVTKSFRTPQAVRRLANRYWVSLQCPVDRPCGGPHLRECGGPGRTSGWRWPWGMRGALVLAMVGLLVSATVVSAQGIDCAPDQGIPLPEGCLFTITGSDTLDPNDGFAVTNAEGVPMWDFVRGRNLQAIGYPISQRWVDGPFTLQAFQKVILQWDPGNGRVNYYNTLDALANDYPGVGLPNVPRHQVLDTSGLSFEEVTNVHLAVLDANPKIKAVFLAEADWLNLYGLPIRYEEREVEGNPQGLQMLRAQRAVFEIWNVEAPGTELGQVSLQNLPDKVKALSNVIIPDAAKAPVTVAGAESLPRFELPAPGPAEPETYAETPDIGACDRGRAVSDPWASAGLMQDCETLLEVRDALASLEGLNWSVDRSISEWDGVVVGGSPPRVREIALRSGALRGQIPAELGKLTELRVLDLSINGLRGQIPADLGRLTHLRELHLGHNDLTGTIPAELGRLNSLELLDLYRNRLTGEIPAELGQLSRLRYLHLFENDLSGKIPAELGQLGSLRELHLGNNNLHGEIPAELGELSRLSSLNLWVNDLSGKIPAELGRLTRLRSLILLGNRLTGEIPPELGQLGSLSALWLSENNLQGELPAELGQLTRLRSLTLHTNQLTGRIPVELSRLTKLEGLSLSNNQLTGAIPAELGRLPSLRSLSLEGNRLIGEIPAELSQLTGLRELSLGNNQLTGEIPVELSRLTALWLLELAHNQLTGAIPPELGRLAKLEEMHLQHNQLTGEIPPALGQLANLNFLYLSHNQLTGAIPAQLGGLTKLRLLRLSGNRFTGCIPVRLKEVSSHDLAAVGLPDCT